MTDHGVTFADIEAAAHALEGRIRETPVWPLKVPAPGQDIDLLLKCEHLQLTGSFKARGALNFVRQLSEEDSRRGLVAMSAGNHAQGVALAAATRDIEATIVVPASAPLAKINATRKLGAKVVVHGASLDEARAEAFAIAEREGRLFVPPFDHDHIIAGQGTAGLEILRQAPDVEEILVPAGGGGLLAGIALAVKSLKPGVRVIGVQSASMEGICKSLEAHKALTVEAHRTISDGVAVSGPSERTYRLIEKYVDDVISVHDEAVAQAIVMLIERAKFVIEGAGALGVAAIMSGRYRSRGNGLAGRTRARLGCHRQRRRQHSRSRPQPRGARHAGWRCRSGAAPRSEWRAAIQRDRRGPSRLGPSRRARQSCPAGDGGRSLAARFVATLTRRGFDRRLQVPAAHRAR
jgi:threonine dehydratase